MLEFGILALGSKACGPAAQDEMLSVLEAILSYDDEVLRIVLVPHLQNLLSALKHTVMSSTEQQTVRTSKLEDKVSSGPSNTPRYLQRQ